MVDFYLGIDIFRKLFLIIKVILFYTVFICQNKVSHIKKTYSHLKFFGYPRKA